MIRSQELRVKDLRFETDHRDEKGQNFHSSFPRTGRSALTLNFCHEVTEIQIIGLPDNSVISLNFNPGKEWLTKISNTK